MDSDDLPLKERSDSEVNASFVLNLFFIESARSQFFRVKRSMFHLAKVLWKFQQWKFVLPSLSGDYILLVIEWGFDYFMSVIRRQQESNKTTFLKARQFFSLKTCSDQTILSRYRGLRFLLPIFIDSHFRFVKKK